jgi:hypothetical protein
MIFDDVNERRGQNVRFQADFMGNYEILWKG